MLAGYVVVSEVPVFVACVVWQDRQTSSKAIAGLGAKGCTRGTNVPWANMSSMSSFRETSWAKKGHPSWADWVW